MSADRVEESAGPAIRAVGLRKEFGPIVAVDGVGAGVGERVMLTSDGRGARELLRARATPVRWTIVAIEDPKAA